MGGGRTATSGRGKAPDRGKAGGQPTAPKTNKPGPVRVPMTSLKGSPEFSAWLIEFAEARRVPISVLIEHALVSYAKETGFREAPVR